MAKTKRICLLLVRLLAFSATLAATIVMATSKQKTSLLTLTFETTYNDTPAFKYFVIANAIVTVYGFLVVFLPSESLLWQLVVAFDAVNRPPFVYVFTVLLSSTISAALAIAEVGKNGDTRAGWLPICRQVPKYCNQVTGALACGFIGAVLYMLLLLHSLHTVLNPLIIQKT